MCKLLAPLSVIPCECLSRRTSFSQRSQEPMRCCRISHSSCTNPALSMLPVPPAHAMSLKILPPNSATPADSESQQGVFAAIYSRTHWCTHPWATKFTLRLCLSHGNWAIDPGVKDRDPGLCWADRVSLLKLRAASTFEKTLKET
jgi:hypothetical protein